MSRKAKFKPVITRIRLNPEQSVLYCECYQKGYTLGRTGIALPNTCPSVEPTPKSMSTAKQAGGSTTS